MLCGIMLVLLVALGLDEPQLFLVADGVHGCADRLDKLTNSHSGVTSSVSVNHGVNAMSRVFLDPGMNVKIGRFGGQEFKKNPPTGGQTNEHLCGLVPHVIQRDRPRFSILV
jgi:hypothetical protein